MTNPKPEEMTVQEIAARQQKDMPQIKPIDDAEIEAARHRDLMLLMEQLENELCH